MAEEQEKPLRTIGFKSFEYNEYTADELGQKLSDSAQKAIFDKNPDLYVYLYSVKENAEKEDGFKGQIAADGKGNPYLSLVNSENTYGLALRDGQVTFSDNMSLENVKECMEFLTRRGVKDFLIPEKLEAKLKENIEKAGQDYEDVKDLPAEKNIDFEQGEQDQSSNETPAERWGKEAEKAAKAKKAEADAMDTSKEGWEGFIQRRGKYKNSGRNTSYEINPKWGGGSEFHVYKNYKYNDKGEKQEPMISIKLKLVKDKKTGDKMLQMGFSTPNGEKIPQEYADEMCGIYKKAGYTHLDLSGVNDEDKYNLHIACAKKLIVPTGANINAKRATAMLRALGEDVFEKRKVQEYKLALAKQMKANAAAAGKTLLEEGTNFVVSKMEGEVKFERFDDVAALIAAHIQKVNIGMELQPDGKYAKGHKDAVKIIGAGAAYIEMIEEYRAKDGGKYKGMLPGGEEQMFQIYLSKLAAKEAEAVEDINAQAPYARTPLEAIKSVNDSVKMQLSQLIQNVKEDDFGVVRNASLAQGRLIPGKYKGLEDIDGSNKNTEQNNPNNPKPFRPSNQGHDNR